MSKKTKKPVTQKRRPDPLVDCEGIGMVPQSTAAWYETARQFARNTEFYRGIVNEIGEMFGDAAKTSDDGSLQDSVLALKVPELVKRALESRSAPAEEWPKDGDCVFITNHTHPEVIGTIQVVDGGVMRCGDVDTLKGHPFGVGRGNYRKPTEAEVASHKAKEEQRAKEAGWAKFDELQVDDCTEDPISEEGAEELANLGLPHYRLGGYGNGYVGWCTDNKVPCIMGVGSLYVGQRLPEAEFLRRAKGTAAKRLEEERAKEMAKPLEFGTRVKHSGKGDCRIACFTADERQEWLLMPEGANATWSFKSKRHEFTILD